MDIVLLYKVLIVYQGNKIEFSNGKQYAEEEVVSVAIHFLNGGLYENYSKTNENKIDLQKYNQLTYLFNEIIVDIAKEKCNEEIN